MKYLWIAVFFCVFTPLFAQERSDIKLYIAPATGGSPEAREFFDVNISEEIRGAHYTIADSPDGADYLVSMTITEDADSDVPGEARFLFTLVVTKASDTSSLVELSWEYANVEEMYQWNLYLIYNALSNIPMSKDSSGAEKTTPAPEAAETDTVSDNRKRAHWLYVGLRGGLSFTRYSFQSTLDYNSGYSTGISGEGGLVVELRLFRFLSFQAEADFIYESFNASRAALEGNARSTDTFTSMSFMFPLMVKVPLKFERFTLSLYAGTYYTLALGEAEKKTGASEETGSVAVKMIDPPLGFTVGTDVGFLVGPGELFADLRYGRNLGVTVIGEGTGPLYIQDRINVCVGYKFGF
ncbi:MAG: PorT family protein [Spirochaetaceae bacterium]|jgi:hypothetical protein|nr:PorT family protein [Spirochaetaceae bacterium]